MLAFLLTISFLLHALSLWIIILLYLRLAKVKEMEKQQQMTEEIEQTFSAYLLEWKEENERFLTELAAILPNRSRTDHLPKDSAEPQAEGNETTAPNEETEPLPSYFPNIDEIKDIVDIRQQPASSAADRVWQLYGQGKTVEEIAKILNKGKTEVELLLKFRQK
ncbi:hypothetical protein H839_04984 [Parageobacillus genomosp. 1]|uniref:Coupling factor for flagellin transcription and translation n=1 Tax=Parageobacillus genomosp. 1 TaxID=1295642 RepID=A0ABC9VH46_9BACL|nr:hypothetical protein [Parageobacillus genomosp. 1]EZP78065.1 hypothetical protein H839_04984 [Parageobacillus genomosp. 1]